MILIYLAAASGFGLLLFWGATSSHADRLVVAAPRAVRDFGQAAVAASAGGVAVAVVLAGLLCLEGFPASLLAIISVAPVIVISILIGTLPLFAVAFLLNRRDVAPRTLAVSGLPVAALLTLGFSQQNVVAAPVTIILMIIATFILASLYALGVLKRDRDVV